MFESLLNLPNDPFSEFERMQRELQQAFANVARPGSIRAVASGAFPAINVGSTATAVEIYAFAPGIDPATLDVQLDRGLLTISGERSSAGSPCPNRYSASKPAPTTAMECCALNCPKPPRPRAGKSRSSPDQRQNADDCAVSASLPYLEEQGGTRSRATPQASRADQARLYGCVRGQYRLNRAPPRLSLWPISARPPCQ